MYMEQQTKKRYTYQEMAMYEEEMERLVSEGKREREPITFGLSDRGLDVVKNGFTFEEIMKELDKKQAVPA
ncbi:hypothetical protein Barb4_02657 [Bacteroidales bacterium Barb4]|nr:hypothetical protein Barb4_02657 [Bacteroidales bacterium Barb4]